MDPIAPTAAVPQQHLGIAEQIELITAYLDHGVILPKKIRERLRHEAAQVASQIPLVWRTHEQQVADAVHQLRDTYKIWWQGASQEVWREIYRIIQDALFPVYDDRVNAVITRAKTMVTTETCPHEHFPIRHDEAGRLGCHFLCAACEARGDTPTIKQIAEVLAELQEHAPGIVGLLEGLDWYSHAPSSSKVQA